MPNAIDLCLAATVAADLGVAVDATIDRMVTAASRAVATFCGRRFDHAAGIVEHPAGYGRPLLLLDRPPIVSIASISNAGELVAADEYEFIADAGMVHRIDGVWPVTARAGGRITDVAELHRGRSDAIVVTYAGGFVTPGQKALDDSLTVTLPEDVQEAAVLTAVAFYRRRGVDPNIASESIGDWSVTYFGRNTAVGRGGAVPDSAQPLLASYVIDRVN